ncbi:MarR family transcriptional regulator [Candidatus Woesearchaeota archaeon]|nr:MarR family transcriptional regulator [Candidatus Woesearchaeota archaeon]
MKIRMLYFSVLIFLLSFHIVSAFEIESYKITAAPSNDDVANSIEITINNTKTSALTQGILHLAKDAEIESIRDSYGTISYSVTEEEENLKVSFSFSIPVQPHEARVVTLETVTHNVVQKEGYFEYLLVLVPSADIENFVHIVKLDKDVVLYNTAQDGGENYLIVPDATVSETADNVVIQWQSALTKDTPSVFLVRFAQETGINYWKWTAILLLTLIFGAGLGIGAQQLYVYRNQQKALKATNILNEREKAVLALIIKNIEIKQYEIIKQLGYTKSNMSKIIKRLELRGLVAVKKEGKIRILTLGEKMKKGV